MAFGALAFSVPLTVCTLAAAEEVSSDISLRKAILSALEHNAGVKIEKINEEIAGHRIPLAESVFDYELRASYRFQSLDRPQNRQDLVATGGGNLLLDSPRIFLERNHLFDSGIGKRTRLGSELEFGTRWSRLDNTLNREVPPSLFFPEFTSFTGLTLTQPLLRDFGIDTNMAPIRIARTDAEIASLNWMGEVDATVGATVRRYIDLAAAYHSLDVRDEAVVLAQKLVADNKARRDEGKMADIDVQEAEVAVSIRREERIAAETDYAEQLNALRMLINPAEEPTKGGRLVPTTEFKGRVPELSNRDELLAMAQENRSDYRIARLELDREEMRVGYAKNQTRPRVDLLATAGLYGLDGGGVGGTYAEALSGQGPEWSLGVKVSIPLGNREAKAQLAIARMQAVQAKLREGRLDLVIALELDTVIMRLETASQRLETAQKTTQLAQSFLELEGQRMAEGKSTSFRVLETQVDLSSSRTRELVATADLEKAMVDLWVVIGTVLDEYDITVLDSSSQPSATGDTGGEHGVDYSDFRREAAK